MFEILAIYCSFLASHIGLIEHSRRVLEQPKTFCGGGEIRTPASLRSIAFQAIGMDRYPTPPVRSSGIEPPSQPSEGYTLSVELRALHLTLYRKVLWNYYWPILTPPTLLGTLWLL